jgi:hypothetical protein
VTSFVYFIFLLLVTVRKADNLPPSSADVTESGSLNLPEPSVSHRPVMGMLFIYLIGYSRLLCSARIIYLLPSNVTLAILFASFLSVPDYHK